MRVYDNGSLFTVTFTENDTRKFSAAWGACCPVKGRGSFQFDKKNGDLADATGAAMRGDGYEWRAFSEDCQNWGEEKLGIMTTHRQVYG